MEDFRQSLQRGLVIPALPLALGAARGLDERRQRALIRYYAAAGVGGLAVGVHTTQFAIHDPKVSLYEPLLELAAEELERAAARCGRPLVRIAGLCGDTRQAVREAETARQNGYHAGLLSLGGGWRGASDEALVAHAGCVARELPLIGFYLQASVGGRLLPYSFWRRFAEIQNLVAIKIAPFNRYQTLDVIRAVTDAGRDDVALYTGNDDNILVDLLTPFPTPPGGGDRRIVGGLLGHWAVWTHRAVEHHRGARSLAGAQAPIAQKWLRLAAEVTDANAAIFDAANGFAGCIPGIHEVLRRQGLLGGVWCLDPAEILSPGQAEEITRVHLAYPHLNDDEFVAAHLDGWLSG